MCIRDRYQRRVHGVPGPGAHEPARKDRNVAPSYSLGRSTRSDMRRPMTPGPGSYDPPPLMTKEGTRPVMTSRHDIHVDNFQPGPGAYDPRVPDKHSPPRYGFRMKTAVPDGRLKAPGPGSYEYGSTVSNVPTYRFGNSKRDGLYRTESVPGPGAYESKPKVVEGPRFGFGSASRDDLHNSSKFVPGPGSYNMRSSIDREHGYSMVARRPESAYVRSSGPGPGAYEPKLMKTAAPSYRLGSASRDGLYKDYASAPGPGAYEPVNKKFKETNIRMGSAKRPPLSASTYGPGPGTYATKPMVGEGPRYAMGGRREEVKDNFAPGPGAYQPSIGATVERQPAIRIGTSSRDGLYKTNDAPGPGEYTYNKGTLAGPKWGFGSGKRDGLYPKSDAPGPGAYSPPAKFADVPKYVIADAPSKRYLQISCNSAYQRTRIIERYIVSLRIS
eukprot:TRINITY_DN242_c0_g1_i2.p1 TRINITY_DN242_c0_g1~~TRINITY_DN242_c0_g1_i2.p1  ORF type:complete len:467 (-),score=74.34 TRINITY_DN242_c0_g1_i2:136-1464(-)